MDLGPDRLGRQRARRQRPLRGRGPARRPRRAARALREARRRAVVERVSAAWSRRRARSGRSASAAGHAATDRRRTDRLTARPSADAESGPVGYSGPDAGRRDRSATMEPNSAAEELPALYRAILDRVAAARARGERQRPTASGATRPRPTREPGMTAPGRLVALAPRGRAPDRRRAPLGRASRRRRRTGRAHAATRRRPGRAAPRPDATSRGLGLRPMAAPDPRRRPRPRPRRLCRADRARRGRRGRVVLRHRPRPPPGGTRLEAVAAARGDEPLAADRRRRVDGAIDEIGADRRPASRDRLAVDVPAGRPARPRARRP